MEPPSRKRRAAAEVVTRGTAEQQGGAGTEGVTRGTASFSPHVTRPTRKARTHSAADAQRRVRTAVWGAGLRLHGALAGASLGRTAVRDAGLRLHGAIAGASPGPRMDVRLGACGARQLPPRAAGQQGGFRRETHDRRPGGPRSNGGTCRLSRNPAASAPPRTSAPPARRLVARLHALPALRHKGRERPGPSFVPAGFGSPVSYQNSRSLSRPGQNCPTAKKKKHSHAALVQDGARRERERERERERFKERGSLAAVGRQPERA